MAAPLKVLTPNMKSTIERELVECAEWANETVNRQHFGGNSPSRSQCQEELGKDPFGSEEEQALRQQGCADELVGTLVPDVVIHSGNPLDVLAVYDFKFPCPTSDEPRWNDYPKGHPYHESNQGAMYHRALGVKPFRVAPIWRIY
ncbi:hypothetical protein F0U60_22000 [Archangium minus]|uniref:Lipoprotein n=1 Tax=Archangium minus TaxID=83450 RepID=A0ABY9WSC3_9BACT|nr:hypothetical protein F0U60_22000 [Archangium minus]